MMELIILLIFILLVSSVQTFLILYLLGQNRDLTSRIMARDYTEYAVQTRPRPLQKGSNFLEKAIKKAYQAGPEEDDDEA
jgi:hypothetical protein